jgi:catechol 1,2-dioxygenase
MANLRTILFYVAGLVALIGLVLVMTQQMEADITPLPAATRPPPATLENDPLAAPIDCRPTPGSLAQSHFPNTPVTNDLAPPDLPGQRMVISGTVYASDCRTSLANAVVEVWHTDTTGEYDRTEPYTLRGLILTDAAGKYHFSSIKPGAYSGGDNMRRPAHIHYQVSYDQGRPFATQLFFAGDPHLSGMSVNPAVLTSLTKQTGAEGPVLVGTFDIILPVEPPAAIPNIINDEDL